MPFQNTLWRYTTLGTHPYGTESVAWQAVDSRPGKQHGYVDGERDGYSGHAPPYRRPERRPQYELAKLDGTRHIGKPQHDVCRALIGLAVLPYEQTGQRRHRDEQQHGRQQRALRSLNEADKAHGRSHGDK